MFIILSQRKDIEMLYSDSLYNVYHFPSKYKNQIHEGDVFVYYQGDRTNKEHRVYFGTGTVGKIHTKDGISYYAELVNCMSFEKEISIYLDGDPKYVETFGFDTIRKSPNPPWQSSIRPLSDKAYQYIISHAGNLTPAGKYIYEEELKSELKSAIKKYYLDGNTEGLKEAYSIIGNMLGVESKIKNDSVSHSSEIKQFIDYCKSMKMTYSYKAVLLLALIDTHDFSITIQDAVNYFRQFYQNRKYKNQKIEKKNCLYQRDDLSDFEIADNIIRNPVNALLKSGYFDYDEAKKVFSVKRVFATVITDDDREEIRKVCNQKLKAYYVAIR